MPAERRERPRDPAPGAERLLAYAPAPDALRGRVILITGAGGGLGRALARGAAAHGATVVLLGRTVPELESAYDEITAAGHPQPAIYPMDLEGALPQHHEELAQRLAGEFGRLDGLVHNAAMLGSLTPFEHYEAVQWARVMQVNLNAPFLMTRACLPLLRGSADASLVFTSCAPGRRGRAYWGAFGVSKFGLEGMMQILAEELEATPAVRVNSIDPGPLRTAMRAAAYPGEAPQAVPAPAEVVPAFLFLLGPDARGVHGRALSLRTRG